MSSNGKMHCFVKSVYSYLTKYKFFVSDTASLLQASKIPLGSEFGVLSFIFTHLNRLLCNLVNISCVANDTSQSVETNYII